MMELCRDGGGGGGSGFAVKFSFERSNPSSPVHPIPSNHHKSPSKLGISWNIHEDSLFIPFLLGLFATGFITFHSNHSIYASGSPGLLRILGRGAMGDVLCHAAVFAWESKTHISNIDFQVT